MYHQYFGLAEAPFSIAVNPRYLYMSPRHRDALAHLLYGVGAGGGFILLTGEVGTGKTTINRCLLEQLPDNADIAIVLNPALDALDLLGTVCDELGISLPQQRPSLKALTDGLHRFLLDNHAAERKTVLMIDEAQHLGFDVLEQIRLLTNLETNEEKLLHIILIGQPELAQKLARVELRQLNQRITARFDLQPLGVAETGAYIRHRLHVAGLAAGRELFSASLVRAIHRRSRGVPRLINLLCDRMLLGAYGRNSAQLDHSLLVEAANEVLGPGVREGGMSNRVRSLVAFTVGVATVLAGWLLLSVGEQGATVVANAPAAQSAVAVAPPAPVEADQDNESANDPNADPVEQGPVLTDLVPDWRLTPGEGVTMLGALYAFEPGTGVTDPCRGALPADLRCERLQVRSWNQLLQDPRPALLALVDEQRFESRALFLGIEQDSAIIAGVSGWQRIALTELATAWTGEYWRLWRQPPEQSRMLALGDEGADVRDLARMFASIDAQSEPLSQGRFNARLETRLRLFQEQQGLEADGILGAQTLRALTLAAGMDLNFDRAREQLANAAAVIESL